LGAGQVGLAEPSVGQFRPAEPGAGQVRPAEQGTGEMRTDQVDGVLGGDSGVATQHGERGLHVRVRLVGLDRAGCSARSG
jgi:hypothetical protein